MCLSAGSESNLDHDEIYGNGVNSEGILNDDTQMTIDDKPVQEPVVNASSIIGKAIAKAMAREKSFRSLTLENYSRDSTPASFSRESSATSSLFEAKDPREFSSVNSLMHANNEDDVIG